jgi:hypothetical protein
MEIAMLVIATVSAMMQGIQIWQTHRDSARASQAARGTYNAVYSDPRTRVRAAALLQVVPQETLERIYKKLHSCYSRMNDMFDGEGSKYFPDQISEAASGALKYCVCDSLQIMKDVEGGLPDEDLEEAWGKYGCEDLLLGMRRASAIGRRT